MEKKKFMKRIKKCLCIVNITYVYYFKIYRKTGRKKRKLTFSHTPTPPDTQNLNLPPKGENFNLPLRVKNPTLPLGVFNFTLPWNSDPRSCVIARLFSLDAL